MYATIRTTSALAGAALVLGHFVGAAGAVTLDGDASFVENFDRVDGQRWYISDGWSNGPHQNCTWSKSEVSASGGVLNLQFEKKTVGDRDYACAEVQTKQRFGYGVYEARMKAVAGSGFNSAFFSYIGSADKQPHDEIDFEVLGKDPSKVQLNQYVEGKGGHEKLVSVPGGADQDFHDYAFVWEPDRIRYYIDGNLVHTVTDASAIPSHAQKIFLSVWASGKFTSWLGAFEAPAQPVAMQVERVSYTKLGESCQFESSVACSLSAAAE